MIYHGDCAQLLEALGHVDCIFADPPDALGLQYDGYDDSFSGEPYYQWLIGLISKSMTKSPVVWLSYYHTHDIEIKKRLHIPVGWEARTFIWTFGFGQNRKTDCGSGYRPILRISKVGTPWDAASIKCPTERQRLGDKRAKDGGAVPLDVWDFPRVAGNFAERRAWHCTQHPIALMQRIYRLSGATCVGPFTVLDLFGGSGTTLFACKELQIKNAGIRYAVAEQSQFYCNKMAELTGCLISKSADEINENLIS